MRRLCSAAALTYCRARVRRHVTDSPGGCKLVAEPSPENESEKLELAVIDKSLVFDEFLFATHLDRCRYIGTSARDRSQWFKDNVGKWHRIRDVQQEWGAGLPHRSWVLKNSLAEPLIQQVTET